MVKIVVDPESTSLQQTFAVIHTPRKSRKRFPEGCVTPVETAEQAYSQAENGPNHHPAIVYGPSVSSESQRIYYLVRWLA
ncbi:MAG: hypothetical protein ACWA5Q_00890 [bacterium]